ncbi:IS66 family insertion sequence element accessory protein TnpA [Marinobacter sp. ELB17]|uniref:IS66 family insertion sequence element accessory protein TnpA n=1 Tax=Marinobacter sp. ELB17 TaxID=270374 RepID=UPI0000F39ADE|nr:hypothetical protein [Marinobacter sp. ELB17]EAZ98513.1 hypothetical protein MELB17_00230 [Marinobacter sp. ELB17]
MTPTERAHVWQQHITDWEASGVSGSAYCKQQSLVYHQFVYWRQKLAPTEGSPKQDQAATGFARVVSAPSVGICEADDLTVSLPGGASITGLHAGNIELLGAVLRQL